MTCRKGVLVFVLFALICVGGSGCTYMQNRGRDAKEMFDVGVTISDQPKFSLYAGFLNILSLGYSDFEGGLYGLGGGEFGAMPARQDAYGVLLWGEEQLGYDVDLDDPDSPKPWNVGIIGLVDGTPPPPEQTVNCPKLLHLGWVGLTMNCKFGEIADFLLGWTTIDIMNDDSVAR